MITLITGSSGRIGSAVAARLQQNGTVIGVDINAGPQTTHVVNLLDHEALIPLVEMADAIVHCAALHAPHVGIESEKAFHDLNVSVTLFLLRASNPLSPFVFTSSTSVYGHALSSPTQACWIDETVLPKPADIYDKTKWEAERVIKSEAASGRAVTTLRMSRCFPETEYEMALYRLYRGVDLRDVVQAHTQALRRNSGHAEYVISGPTPFIHEDIEALKNDPRQVLAERIPEALTIFEQKQWPIPVGIDRVYSSALAQQEMGYKPRYGFFEFVGGDRNPEPTD